MPNVEEDTKLDFKDVLLRPKRSKIKSRADVSSKTLFSNEMANHIYFKIILRSLHYISTFNPLKYLF